MVYIYKGKNRDNSTFTEEEARAKFAYFREAEANINGGPAKHPTYKDPGPKPPPPKRQRAKCGTNGGYRRHLKDGTKACNACRTARVEYQREYRRRRAINGPQPRPAGSSKPGPPPQPPKPFNPELCGTMRGYRQHRRHKQDQCPKCKQAQNAYHAGWRAMRGRVKAKQ